MGTPPGSGDRIRVLTELLDFSRSRLLTPHSDKQEHKHKNQEHDEHDEYDFHVHSSRWTLPYPSNPIIS